MADIEIINSILFSVKKSLGLPKEAVEFDEDVIMAINSSLNVLNQLGVGEDGFSISDETSTWSEFLGETSNFEMAKNYVCLKVGLLFDPPQSSAISEVKKTMLSELEWRLTVNHDTYKE